MITLEKIYTITCDVPGCRHSLTRTSLSVNEFKLEAFDLGWKSGGFSKCPDCQDRYDTTKDDNDYE